MIFAILLVYVYFIKKIFQNISSPGSLNANSSRKTAGSSGIGSDYGRSYYLFSYKGVMIMNERFRKIFIWFPVMILLAAGLLPSELTAQELSRGQLVYVPIYSHIYYGDREQAFLLTGTLSIRNTDPAHPITLLKVDYYDSDGKLVRKNLSRPVNLGPLGSTRFVVKASDTSGGSGANFLVQWKADNEVNTPILEGVMIGAAGQQGISFTSRGQAIKDR